MRPTDRRPAERAVITASRAKAEWNVPTLKPGRRRSAIGRWLALAGTLVAVGVVIALIVDWASDSSTSLRVADATPTVTLPARKPATPAPAVAAPAAAPSAKPAVRSRRCDPIFGGGTPHPVTSSARDGDPAGCGEAHSVLLAALNGGGTGGWHCTTNPSGRILAACTSNGGSRVVAGN